MKNLEMELKELVARERGILHEILLKIREIDASRLYLSRGYPSLFEYLTREIGYSQGAAQRRIDAARLSREIPELIEHVRDGSLNLSQISEAQRGFRQRQASHEEKRFLLERLMRAPSREAEKIVAESLHLPVMQRHQSRPQADGSVRLALTLSEEAAANLETVKQLLSHSIPGGNPAEIFEKLLAFYLEKQPKSRATAAPAVNSRQKTVPQVTRREIIARDKCCQFRSENGHLCGSRFQLQIDHRQMRFYGGTHEPANLRLLCAAHNRYVAQQIMAGEPAD